MTNVVRLFPDQIAGNDHADVFQNAIASLIDSHAQLTGDVAKLSKHFDSLESIAGSIENPVHKDTLVKLSALRSLLACARIELAENLANLKVFRELLVIKISS